MTDRVNELVERLRKYNPPDRTIDEQRQIAVDIHEAADMLVELRESVKANTHAAQLAAADNVNLREENERLSALLREQWEADSALYNAPHDVDSLVYAAMLERHDRSHAAIDAALERK
jgi:hypothetical protein